MTGSARRRKAEDEATAFTRAVDAGVAAGFDATDVESVTGDALTDALATYVAAAVRRRLRGAEKSADRSAMHYAGVWCAGTVYRKGDVVTYRGTTWHANEETTAQPGTSSAFTMMAKSAR